MISGYLAGGVYDRPFKQYLTRALSAKLFKEHIMEIVLAIGFQVLRQNICDEFVSHCTRGQLRFGCICSFMLAFVVVVVVVGLGVKTLYCNEKREAPEA